MSFKRYHSPGTAPGTLRTSSGSEGGVAIRLIDYSEADFVEDELISIADCQPYLSRNTKTWIQINGHPDAALLRHLGDGFGLHELALEDVHNLGQRPKVDIYNDQIFLTSNLPILEDGELRIVQISLFIGADYLICFCPEQEDPFEPIRRRLRPPNNTRLRSRNVDYLLYALLDLIIDSAFPILEQFGDNIEDLEDRLLQRPDRKTLSDIHVLRRHLLLLRRMVWPQRELLASLLRDDIDLIETQTQPFLRDCYDHAIQIMDLQEGYREMTASLLDVYLSSISHRTNEVMRVLTIIATIFIPLTFIVGIYGMNFAHEESPWAMPELYWYYGYPMIWGVMISVTLGMLWFFRRRKWL